MRKNLEEKGRKLVQNYFEQRGFSVELECWRAKDVSGKIIYGLGEVDLFLVHPAKKLALLIEVKSRRSFEGPPLVFPSQLQRLRRSRAYLQRKYSRLQVLLGLACVKVPTEELQILWNP